MLKDKEMTANSTITIYGAGGCGINLASRFKNFEKKPGYASIRTVYLDCGGNNFPKDASDDQCKNLTDNDGSGKVRAYNAAAVAEKIPDVVTTHAPTAFNIIIFSASGGSGSTIGPLLSRELTRKEVPHIIILVGDNESHTSAKNTYKCYLSLEHISQSVKMPITLAWHKNSAETPRTVVDKNVYEEIMNIARLCSGQNRDLDTKDLANWVHYTIPEPELIPQLSLLTITTDANKANQIKNPLSVAHLLKGETSLPKEFSPNFSIAGYLPEGEGGNESGIIYVISTDEVEDVSQIILNDYEKFEELSKSRSKLNPTLVKESDKVSDEGLIF